MQKYTFPRIRQCFSQRILSFLMFFTLISAVCRLDGGSFIGSFWICKTWVQNHFSSACAKFFLFLSITSLTFSLFLIFNRLIMRWLSLLCSVIDGRNVYKIHHAIHHLLPLSITSFSLSSCWKCFFYARDSGQRWKFSGQSLHLALKFCIFAECWQHRFHNGNNHCET